MNRVNRKSNIVNKRLLSGAAIGYFPAMPQAKIAPAKKSSLLQRAFVACVICLAVFQFSENTTDIDLWGHVLFGQEFLHTGHLARTDTYSWTRQRPAVDQPRNRRRSCARARAPRARRHRTAAAENGCWLADLRHRPVNCSQTNADRRASHRVGFRRAGGRGNFLRLRRATANLHRARARRRAVDSRRDSSRAQSAGRLRCRCFLSCG